MGNDCVFGCFILKEKETKIDFRAEVRIGSQVMTRQHIDSPEISTVGREL